MSTVTAPLSRWFYQGQVAANAKVNVYATGTTTPVTVYADAALTTPTTNPVTTDSNGEALFYVDSGTALRLYVTTSGGTLIRDIDPVYPAAVASGSAATSPATLGECRLAYTNSTTVTLQRFRGQRVSFPDGSACVIPAAGIPSTVTNCYVNGVAGQTLTAGTLYYAYLAKAGSNYVLDFSTAGHSTDSTSGIEVKTGDATRVFLGWVYPTAGPVFQDSATNRYVKSWFNRVPKSLVGQFAVNRSTAATSAVEVGPDIRVGFIADGSEAVPCSAAGTTTNDTAGRTNYTGVGLDGATTILAIGGNYVSSAGAAVGAAVAAAPAPAEGPHFLTVVGQVSAASTATWIAGTSFQLAATVWA